MMIGLDTGFFIELSKRNSLCVEKWKNIVDSVDDAVVCSLSIYELKKISLKGGLDGDAVEKTIEALLAVCKVVWIDNCAILFDAAGYSHGLGIPTTDAIILASFVNSDVDTIYTTDRHLQNYKKKGAKIINILTANI